MQFCDRLFVAILAVVLLHFFFFLCNFKGTVSILGATTYLKWSETGLKQTTNEQCSSIHSQIVPFRSMASILTEH